MSGFRSALETVLRRGAGVLPPTAHTFDAFAPTVSEATASPPLSGTIVPVVGRALVGASQAAPCPPGFSPAPETTTGTIVPDRGGEAVASDTVGANASNV